MGPLFHSEFATSVGDWRQRISGTVEPSASSRMRLRKECWPAGGGLRKRRGGVCEVVGMSGKWLSPRAMLTALASSPPLHDQGKRGELEQLTAVANGTQNWAYVLIEPHTRPARRAPIVYKPLQSPAIPPTSSPKQRPPSSSPKLQIEQYTFFP